MRIDVLTIFPDLFAPHCEQGIWRIALQRRVAFVHVHNLRDFADDSHRTVDDYPYGGGPGMIMKPEPIFRAVEHLRESDGKVVLLSPQGKPYRQDMANRFSTLSQLILICGRYRGTDERIRSVASLEVSIGDYVLSGGELAAMVIIDSILRLLPGVLGDIDSAMGDSFFDGVLDYPHYTRPEDFRGMRVPSVLLSGNHGEIARWRRRRALENTLEHRPDLLTKEDLSDEDLDALRELGFDPEIGR